MYEEAYAKDRNLKLSLYNIAYLYNVQKNKEKAKEKISPCKPSNKLCSVLSQRIEKTRKQILGLNLQARIEKNHKQLIGKQKKD